MTWKRCIPICDIILLFIHKEKKLNKQKKKPHGGQSEHETSRMCNTGSRCLVNFGISDVDPWISFSSWISKRRVMTRVWVSKTFWFAVDCTSNQTFKFWDSTSSGKKIKFRRNETVVSECYPEHSLISHCVWGQLNHLRITDWLSTGSVLM